MIAMPAREWTHYQAMRDAALELAHKIQAAAIDMQRPQLAKAAKTLLEAVHEQASAAVTIDERDRQDLNDIFAADLALLFLRVLPRDPQPAGACSASDIGGFAEDEPPQPEAQTG